MWSKPTRKSKSSRSSKTEPGQGSRRATRERRSFHRWKVDLAGDDQDVVPCTKGPVLHGPSGGPCIPEVPHRNRVVGIDGLKVACHIRVSAVERRTHGAGFLQVPKINLHTEALQRRGIQLGQGVQGPQRVRHVPGGLDGAGLLRGNLRLPRGGNQHIGDGRGVGDFGRGVFQKMLRCFLTPSEQPLPPGFSPGLGGICLGERRLRKDNAGCHEPQTEAE